MICNYTGVRIEKFGILFLHIRRRLADFDLQHRAAHLLISSENATVGREIENWFPQMGIESLDQNTADELMCKMRSVCNTVAETYLYGYFNNATFFIRRIPISLNE